MSEVKVTPGIGSLLFEGLPQGEEIDYELSDDVFLIEEGSATTLAPPPTSIQAHLSDDKTEVIVDAVPAGADAIHIACWLGTERSGLIYSGTPTWRDPLPTMTRFTPAPQTPVVSLVARRAGADLGSWTAPLVTVPSPAPSPTPSPKPAPTPTPAARKIVGISTSYASSYDGDPGYFIKDAVALGAPVIRVDCWTAAEAKAHHDLMVKYGGGMLPLVNSYSIDPTNIAAWVAAAKAAAPYSTVKAANGKYVIDLSNEMFWKGSYNRPLLNGKAPETRPGDAARMWKAVVEALPNVNVIVPVALPASGIVDWIGGANAAVPGIFDSEEGGAYGVSVHIYGNHTIDDGSKAQWHYGMWEGIAERLRAIVGRDVPQWWTEVGQELPAVTADYQAKAATRVLHDLATHDAIEAVFWFNHKDWHPADVSKDTGWGLIDDHGNPRPARAAFQAGAKALTSGGSA